MPPYPSSTIGQLLYDAKPDLCFARLVSELDSALAAVTSQPRRLVWDHDDVAVVDFDGARILLGYCEDVPRPWAACLSVSVGHGPQEGDCLLSERHAPVARMIAERLSSRLPPAETRWLSAPVIADADLIDALIAGIGDRIDPAEPVADPKADAVPADRLPRVDDGLVEHALSRAEAAFVARQAALDAAEEQAAGPRRKRRVPLRRRKPTAAPRDAVPGAAEIANDLPDLPRPFCADAAMIRAALYAPEDGVARPTAQMRLAAHAVNATVMVVALPVGAGLMTYSLLRGENLRLSARSLALVGAFLGLAQGQFGAFMPPGL